MPLIFLLCFISASSFATGLINRYQYLSAQTLPDGVWTFGVSHGQSMGSGNASFGANGSALSNQEYFSRNISYGNLIDEINDPLEKELAAAAFDAYEKPLNEDAGRVVNDVSVTQKSDAYVLGRGFGKRNSFFIIFPVITLNTSFKSRFNQSSSLQELAEQLQSEGQFQKAQEILEKSQNALAERLEENSYRKEYPRGLTTLANIYLNHRFKALETGFFTLTTDSSVIVPAGEKSDEDDFIYLRINEEQYSYRQGLIAEYAATAKASLLGSTYYHKRFSFEKARRIPVNKISPLSSEVDPNTSMKYGDTMGASAQINYSLLDGLTLYGGQSFEIKERDQITGNKFAKNRYEYLESNSAQELMISYLGITVNTIQSFLKQQFPIPVEMNLQYSLTQAGRNAFDNEAVALNLMVFYK